MPGTRGFAWVLRVEPRSAEEQRIELFRMGDGYWGGVYDATSHTAIPRYRKITGPGFAFIVGPLALLLNGTVWAIVATVVWAIRRRHRSAASPG